MLRLGLTAALRDDERFFPQRDQTPIGCRTPTYAPSGLETSTLGYGLVSKWSLASVPVSMSLFRT